MTQLAKKKIVPLLGDADKVYGVDINLLAAVIMVESAGSGYDLKGRLLIQFEPHWFVKIHNQRSQDKYTYKLEGNRMLVYHKDKLILSNGVENQDREWEAFNTALKYDEYAAYQSTSYGMPQIMGFNYRLCEYDSAKAMFEAFRDKGEKEHVQAFLRFLNNAGLMKLIRDKEIGQFCYRYNGPAYKQNNYDRKILFYYDLFKKTT